MKLTETENIRAFPNTGTFNVFTLAGISFIWAHFLGLISLWFIPLTVLLCIIGYGSEVRPLYGLKQK
jgi:hypothetical protein